MNYIISSKTQFLDRKEYAGTVGIIRQDSVKNL